MRPLYIVFAVLVGSIGISSNSQADATPKIHKHVVSHAVRTKAKVKKHKAKRQARKPVKHASAAPKVEIRHDVPVPGSEGEDRDFWFYQRRAWPNDDIDPEMYSAALEQARSLPKLLFGRSGKHQVASSLTWTSIGPTAIDGRVTAIVTHPTDPNTFYVGAANGGLWRTNDHGVTWKCVTDTFGSLAIGCVAIDPVTPDTLYLGMGECNGSADSYAGNGIWKSTDAGATWQSIGFAKTQYIAKIVVDPTNHNTIWTAISGSKSSTSDSIRGVFKSTDGGETWTRSLLVRAGRARTSTPVPIVDLAIDPVNTNNMVAFAWHQSGAERNCGPYTGLWRSSDAGASWSRIDTMSGSGLPNGSLEKVLGRGAVYWSRGNGTSGVSYVYAAFTRADSNEVTHYRTDENFKGLYRSSDDGLHWQRMIDSTFMIPYGLQGRDSCDLVNKQGGYNFYLAGNPAHPSELYLGGIDVLRSTDFGASFTDITRSYSQYYINGDRAQHSDQHGLAFAASETGNDLLVVSDGGVFHTSDFGTSWKQLPGLPITMFYGIEPWAAGMATTGATVTPSELRVFGGTQDNGTVAKGLTNDPEFVWINHGDGGIAQSHPTDKEKIISSLQFGKIFARNSIDSLTTVTPIRDANGRHAAWHTITKSLLNGILTDTTEPAGFIAPVVLDNERPSDLYTARLHVYKATIDWNDLDHVKWQNWSPTIAGDTSNPGKWYYGDIETLALGVRDATGKPMLWAGGYIYQTPSSSVWRTVVDPTRPDTVAPQWIKVNSGLPGTTVSSIVPDRSDSLTAFITLMGSDASDNRHVMMTSDGGAHWLNISSNLPHAPTSALVIDTASEAGDTSLKNHTLIVATDVGVFATTNLGTTWNQLGDGMPHVIVSDLKIYKNMLIAATHGRSLYALDISGLQAASGVASPESAAASSIYPNPVAAGGAVTITNATSTPITMISEASGASIVISSELTPDGLSIVIPSSTTPGAYLVSYIDRSGMKRSGRIVVRP